jgi:hypothetical protein
VAGFVPALERLAVREISGRFLSQDERIEMADLRHTGLSIRQVADRLGRAPLTISRELRRNAAGSEGPEAGAWTGAERDDSASWRSVAVGGAVATLLALTVSLPVALATLAFYIGYRLGKSSSSDAGVQCGGPGELADRAKS